QVLQQLLEAHRQFKKDAAESLVSSLTEMSHRQLAQVYRNLKDNSSILSAISQTHGDTSDLFVFAEGILNLVTNTVRQRDMSADDIKPKPFDVHVPENNAIIKTLAALASVQKIKIVGGGKPEPRELIKIFQDHPSVFSSKELWSSDKFQDN